MTQELASVLQLSTIPTLCSSCVEAIDFFAICAGALAGYCVQCVHGTLAELVLIYRL